MGKIASRTKFNTDYMPRLEKDEIESNDNLRPERNVITSDIVREDNKRFFALGRQTGWDLCPESEAQKRDDQKNIYKIRSRYS